MSVLNKDYSGRKLSNREADAVIAGLKEYLMALADRCIFKGALSFRIGKGNPANGSH
jgi:hypothetical protein